VLVAIAAASLVCVVVRRVRSRRPGQDQDAGAVSPDGGRVLPTPAPDSGMGFPVWAVCLVVLCLGILLMARLAK
jgi:hypothetical protein